jgi:hypothetical protein
MEKIDRLGWAGGYAFRSYGVSMGVRVSDVAVMEQVAASLPVTRRAAASPVVDTLFSLKVGGESRNAQVRKFHLLYEGASLMARSLDLNELLPALEARLDFYVSLLSRDKLFVQADVVGLHGKAIVLPGMPNSGKTALVEALIKAGGVCYSDKYAVFDQKGHVHPYLGKRRPARKRSCPPISLGLVLESDYRAKATWRPQPLSPGQTVLSLLKNAPVARLRTSFALETLQRAATSAIALRSKGGEADRVVASLLQHLD